MSYFDWYQDSGIDYEPLEIWDCDQCGEIRACTPFITPDDKYLCPQCASAWDDDTEREIAP